MGEVLIMNELINQKVKHIRFSTGKVIGIVGEDKIIVEFDSLERNLKFKYPEAFEKFLEFENKSLQEKALKQLEEKKALIKKEIEEKILELNREYEEHRKEVKKLTRKTRKKAK